MLTFSLKGHKSQYKGYVKIVLKSLQRQFDDLVEKHFKSKVTMQMLTLQNRQRKLLFFDATYVHMEKKSYYYPANGAVKIPIQEFLNLEAINSF